MLNSFDTNKFKNVANLCRFLCRNLENPAQRLDPLTNNAITNGLGDGLRKGMFLPPTIDAGTFKSRYRFRDFWKKEIKSDDVIFGHKVFRLPTFRLECLKRIDRGISPKLRIILSFMVIYRKD